MNGCFLCFKSVRMRPVCNRYAGGVRRQLITAPSASKQKRILQEVVGTPPPQSETVWKCKRTRRGCTEFFSTKHFRNQWICFPANGASRRRVSHPRKPLISRREETDLCQDCSSIRYGSCVPEARRFFRGQATLALSSSAAPRLVGVESDSYPILNQQKGKPGRTCLVHRNLKTSATARPLSEQ